jgi:transposase
MENVTVIGVDLAKSVFQLHGAATDGSVVFRKKLSRGQFQLFMERHPRCQVAMEACASAHHWGRIMEALGYEVRLIPPVYVKPFVKRQKNDANDAEAIVEASFRPPLISLSYMFRLETDYYIDPIEKFQFSSRCNPNVPSIF